MGSRPVPAREPRHGLDQGLNPALADLLDELLATVREIRAYEWRLQLLRSRRTIDTSDIEADLEMRCFEAERRLEWLREQRDQANGRA